MDIKTTPLHIRRRIKFTFLNELFERYLRLAKEEYKEFKWPFTPFYNFIISSIMESLFLQDESLELKYFDDIWYFVKEYYRQRIIDEYNNIG